MALAVLRVTAWLAVIIGSVVTILLALFVWDVPTGDTFRSYFYGTAIGAWAVAWIVLWGVVLYNTMVVTGSFDRLKEWLIQQATRDIRIQTILLAWAFGALLEGLVGFGYPWPLAVAGSFGYIAGQYPIAEFVGPYLPDIVGSLTAFAAVFVLIRFWRPREVMGFGGVVLEEPGELEIAATPREAAAPVAVRESGSVAVGARGGRDGGDRSFRGGGERPQRPLTPREALYGLV